MKRILITGHKGFLGSYLFELLRDYYVVYGIDLVDGNNIFNINGLTGIDIVIHCAALTSVSESIKKSSDYYRTNLLGTTHLVNQCLWNNVQMIYISSAAIYDMYANPYANSKFQAHEVVETFLEELRGVIFVPYNIYATKPKANSLFGKMLYSPELTIYGNGKQTRDFINIVDIGNVIKLAIDEEWEEETMDLGTGKSTSVNEVVNLFAKYTNKRIVHVKKSGGVKHSKADIGHLKNHYKTFKTDIEKDIEEMVNTIN